MGGVSTEVNEYPWQAGLVGSWSCSSPGACSIFCGGSLVNTKWVLSAAHCTEDQAPGDIKVILGAHVLNDWSQATPMRMDVAEIINHPNYNPRKLNRDFSMIKLAEAVDYDAQPHIRPVCLPPPDEVSSLQSEY